MSPSVDAVAEPGDHLAVSLRCPQGIRAPASARTLAIAKDGTQFSGLGVDRNALLFQAGYACVAWLLLFGIIAKFGGAVLAIPEVICPSICCVTRVPPHSYTYVIPVLSNHISAGILMALMLFSVSWAEFWPFYMDGISCSASGCSQQRVCAAIATKQWLHVVCFLVMR